MSDGRFRFLYLRISQKMCNFAPFLKKNSASILEEQTIYFLTIRDDLGYRQNDDQQWE